MIQLYSLKMDRELKEPERQQIMNIVTPERKAKALRFRRFEDQCRGLATGLLESYVCRKEFGITNLAGKIELGEQGKPYIIGQEETDYHYNISHSGGWIVCGASRMALGVDVEQEAKYREQVVKRFFPEQEKNDILGRAEAERPKVFAEYWTMKESVMKYTGLGFALPIRKFLTNRENGLVEFLWDSEKNEEWQKRLLEQGISIGTMPICQVLTLEPGYACSVCSGQREPVNQIPVTVEECLQELLKATHRQNG